MVNTKIEDIISKETSFDKVEAYVFKMDSNGPKYKIKFGRNYSSPSKAISENDFYFEMLTPNKIISDDRIKVNLLDRLYTNPNSSANH